MRPGTHTSPLNSITTTLTFIYTSRCKQTKFYTAPILFLKNQSHTLLSYDLERKLHLLNHTRERTRALQSTETTLHWPSREDVLRSIATNNNTANAPNMMRSTSRSNVATSVSERRRRRRRRWLCREVHVRPTLTGPHRPATTAAELLVSLYHSDWGSARLGERPTSTARANTLNVFFSSLLSTSTSPLVYIIIDFLPVFLSLTHTFTLPHGVLTLAPAHL